MGFTLLPAVDVAGGAVAQSAPSSTSSVTGRTDPRAAALAWQADGAEWIHLVDLDAAFGRGSNAALLAAVVGALDVDVQLSGGIRDDASLRRALDTGCTRVNIATEALDDLAWCSRVIATHGERVSVSLDVRVTHGRDGTADHRLAARGRATDGGSLWETLARLDEAGGSRYVVTDVTRDGNLRGPDFELYRAVTSATTAKVIASGGISSIDDLVLLAEAASAAENFEGAIVGTALHAGRFTLRGALGALRRTSEELLASGSLRATAPDERPPTPDHAGAPRTP